MLIFIMLKINKGIPPLRTIEGYENIEMLTIPANK